MAEFAVVKAFNTANLPRTLSDKPAAVTAADTRSSRDSGRPEKVEGKTGDVGLDEIHWSALINRYTTEYAAHDAAAMRHVDGLTAEQVEEQRKSAESRMAWMKAANAKKLFQMAVGKQIVQNVEEAVESGATVVITGLPIDLQVVARLVDRLSSFGHVLVATRRKGRALVTFGAQEGAVRALVDASLRQAGMTLRAINLADAKSNGVEHDMALEHQEKLAARHSLANIGIFAKAGSKSHLGPQDRWAIRMGLLQPGARSRVLTPERKTHAVYADAVAAINLPEKERQWRLRHPMSVRSKGRVITVKNEVEYDEALDKTRMRDSAWFATTEIQFTLGNSEVAFKAEVSTSSVKGWDVRIGDTMRSARLLEELRRIIGRNKDGEITCLVSPHSSFGDRALGRKKITSVSQLEHGQTYLMRRGIVSRHVLEEAQLEDRAVIAIQRAFRERVARRRAAYPDRHLPGWGMVTERGLQLVLWIQRRFKKRFARHKTLEQKQSERNGSLQHARPLKQEQAIKMQNLAVLPARGAYKPSVSSARPLLRSAHDIFSDPVLHKHKQWTRTAPAQKVNSVKSPKPTTGGRIRARAEAVHSIEHTTRARRPTSASTAVMPTSPTRLKLHGAGHARPQSARADFSAPNARATHNPSPPPLLTPGRTVRSAPSTGRRIRRPTDYATAIPVDCSTFGGIQQRGGRFCSANEPLAGGARLGKQDRTGDARQANVAKWWVEEQSLARQRCQTVRGGDKPAWNTSTSLAR